MSAIDTKLWDQSCDGSALTEKLIIDRNGQDTFDKAHGRDRTNNDEKMSFFEKLIVENSFEVSFRVNNLRFWRRFYENSEASFEKIIKIGNVASHLSNFLFLKILSTAICQVLGDKAAQTKTFKKLTISRNLYKETCTPLNGHSRRDVKQKNAILFLANLPYSRGIISILFVVIINEVFGSIEG